MANKYYLSFLKKAMMKLAESNRKFSNEMLLGLGAEALANKVALDERLSVAEKEKLCKTASTTFGFNWGGFAHKLSYDKRQGYTYDMTKSGIAFTEQILLDKEVEDYLKMDQEKKNQEIVKLQTQHKRHETIWRRSIGDQHTLPKKVEKKPERETVLFNMLIDGLMEKTPAKTTTAGSITNNLWWTRACEVARDLGDDAKLLDIGVDDEDGLNFIQILDDEGDTFHEFKQHQTGIKYIYKYKKEEEKSFFVEYEEIVKKKKTNME